jgi:cation:H+ antiporter
MIGNILLFLLGLVALWGGAELLVKGSSRMALLLRIRPLIVGLTVVAFGTSFPEFVTTIVAAWQDKIDVAIGNIVGSNIANIGLILGLSGIILPVVINPTSVKKEMMWMIGASALFWLFALNGLIGHIEGAVLFFGIIVFTLSLVIVSLNERNNNQNVSAIALEKSRLKHLSKPRQFILYSIMTGVGILILMQGSNWLIESATNIARLLGISEIIIGLSLVAFGTSLPELATAIISMIKKENDILIGNIIGSNIFNLLFVGGFLAMIFTAPINQRVLVNDLPVMMGISLFLVPIIYWRQKISRFTGGILFLVYIIYIIYIFT